MRLWALGSGLCAWLGPSNAQVERQSEAHSQSQKPRADRASAVHRSIIGDELIDLSRQLTLDVACELRGGHQRDLRIRFPRLRAVEGDLRIAAEEDDLHEVELHIGGQQTAAFRRCGDDDAKVGIAGRKIAQAEDLDARGTQLRFDGLFDAVTGKPARKRFLDGDAHAVEVFQARAEFLSNVLRDAVPPWFVAVKGASN